MIVITQLISTISWHKTGLAPELRFISFMNKILSLLISITELLCCELRTGSPISPHVCPNIQHFQAVQNVITYQYVRM